MGTLPANQTLRPETEDKRSPASSSANQPLPPRVRKRRIAEDMGASTSSPTYQSLRPKAKDTRSPASSSLNPPLRPIAKKRRSGEDTGASEAVELAVGFLEDEFKQRETASQEFPPEISSSHIRSSISLYEDKMLAASQRSKAD